MPSRNRVDDLEAEVDELKATVTGLTEELVEAHERIRQIERALAGDSGAARDAAREAAAAAAEDIETSIRDAPHEVAAAAANARPENAAGETADAAGETADADESGPTPGGMVVDGGSTGTEGDKGRAAEGGDEAEGDADDIIVA